MDTSTVAISKNTSARSTKRRMRTLDENGQIVEEVPVPPFPDRHRSIRRLHFWCTQDVAKWPKLATNGHITYLFAGSDAGGERAAIIYSLLGTAKLNGIDPEGYLRYVLDRIAEHPINRVDELLPWNLAGKITPEQQS